MHAPVPLVVRALAGVLAALLGLLAVGSGARPAAAELVGSVSGTVRAAGAPVANAWVTLTPVTPTGDWAGRPATTSTDADGHFRFSELYAFHVKIHVRAPSLSGLASAYWPQAYSFAAAGTLRVAGSGSTADVSLPPGGRVSGRVVDAASGEPIPGARVQAHVDAAPGSIPVGFPGLAAGPGEFVLDGLPPVPVALQARPPEGSNHLGQWYDAAGFFAAATPVETGAVDLEIGLPEGGEIGGSVHDDAGRPVAGARVTVIGCPGLCPLAARTDAAGRYRITAVPSGPLLRVRAEAGDAGLLGQWYSGPADPDTSGFALDPGQARPAVDFTLTRGARVSGAVLDARTGEPIPGAVADLVLVDNPLRSYASRPATRDVAAQSAARFTIGPVPPGRYSVVVIPGLGNSPYVPVRQVAARGLDSAGRVDLAAGQHAEVVISLARGADPGQRPAAPGPTVATGRPPDAPEPGSWPGLAGGFLTDRSLLARWATGPG